MCLLKLYNACCVKFEKKDTDGINKNPCMSTKKKKVFISKTVGIEYLLLVSRGTKCMFLDNLSNYYHCMVIL